MADKYYGKFTKAQVSTSIELAAGISYSVIAAILTYIANILGLITFDPEYAFWVGLAIALMRSAAKYLLEQE